MTTSTTGDETLDNAKKELKSFRRQLRNARVGDYTFDALSIVLALLTAAAAYADAPAWLTVTSALCTAGFTAAQKVWNPGRRRVAAATATVQIENLIARYRALDHVNRTESARLDLADKLIEIKNKDQKAWLSTQEEPGAENEVD